MTTISDPDASRAVLVGVARYTALENLPAVSNNLLDLKRALADKDLWGLPTRHCVILEQPQSADAIFDALHVAASTATDTLIFYFAGHGLVDPESDDELFLALPKSNRDWVHRTAVPFDWIRREIRHSKARRKVLILDCCYSGRALGRMGESQPDFAGKLEIEGTCVLTATAGTVRAMAPPGWRHTAFTGELIDILVSGIANGSELLNMDSIYRDLILRLRAKNLPSPQRGQLDQGGSIALARNRRALAPPERRAYPAGVSAVSAKLRPDTNASPDEDWHSAIDPNTRLWVSGPYGPTLMTPIGAGMAMLLALAGWLALSIWLSWSRQPSWELYVCDILGLAGMTILPIRDRDGRKALLIFSTCVFYIWELVIVPGWLVRGYAAGAFVLCVVVLATIGGFKWSIGYYRKEKARYERELVMTRTVKQVRWIRDEGSHDPGSEVLGPLAMMPSARFGSIAGSQFRFFAVAGDKVVLVAFAHWPVGSYSCQNGVVFRNGQFDRELTDELSEFNAELAHWKDALAYSGKARVVVVAQPASADGASTISVRSSGESDLQVATVGDFGAVAGSFLVSESGRISMYLIPKLLAHVDATSSSGDAAALPSLQPRPAAAGAARLAEEETPEDSASTELPSLDQFDSVAADSMRYARVLRGIGEPIDTHAILLAVARVHVLGRWERISLHISRSVEDIARQEHLSDPRNRPYERWNDVELTATCADALRAAARLGRRYDVPIAPGILLLGLIDDPDSAAAQALGAGTTIAYTELRQLIADELLDIGELDTTGT